MIRKNYIRGPSEATVSVIFLTLINVFEYILYIATKSIPTFENIQLFS